MRRAAAVLLTPLIALLVLVLVPERASAQCVAPPGPAVPATVHAGDLLALSGAALFECRDTVQVGGPTPTPGPVPRTLAVRLEKTPSFDGGVIGSVPVNSVSADHSSGTYNGQVTIPAATAPGSYAISVDGAGRSATFRVLAATSTAGRLPFTGHTTWPQVLAGLAAIACGVAFCLAGRRTQNR
jgi:hypothetical protein